MTDLLYFFIPKIISKCIVDIPVNTTDTILVKEILEGMDGIGTVSVRRYGDCYGQTWKIVFESNPGRQPLMEINDEFVTGDHPQLTTEKLYEGHYLFNPLPGDMLSTVHTVPQVYFPLFLHRNV